jgi:hypothetical protein
MRPIDLASIANRLASEIDDRYPYPDMAMQIAKTLRARAGQLPADLAPA